MDKIKEIGTIIGGFLIFLALIIVVIMLFKGAVYVVGFLLPLSMKIVNIVLPISIFILLPLAIFKKTRPIASIGLLISSFIFGFSAWLYGFAITYNFWGIIGVIAGLVLMGIGVIPTAIAATLINGEWFLLGQTIFVIAITYIARLISLSLAKNIDKNEDKLKEIVEP